MQRLPRSDGVSPRHSRFEAVRLHPEAFEPGPGWRLWLYAAARKGYRVVELVVKMGYARRVEEHAVRSSLLLIVAVASISAAPPADPASAPVSVAPPALPAEYPCDGTAPVFNPEGCPAGALSVAAPSPVPANCGDRIERVREELGQPKLQRETESPDKPLLIAAVDKRIDGCAVMQMHRDVNDLRPLPEPSEGPVRLMPVR